jgi:hypothetical protein
MMLSSRCLDKTNIVGSFLATGAGGAIRRGCVRFWEVKAPAASGFASRALVEGMGCGGKSAGKSRVLASQGEVSEANVAQNHIFAQASHFCVPHRL